MAFKDIAGNVRVKKTLRMALKRCRTPNSLLFSGPEGVGKKSMALTLAKALNCLEAKDDACEECESCKAIQNDRFPDVMVLAPETNFIKIEQMRFLKQMAYLKPLSGKARVFLIEEAEKMNEEAANSLLKVLEEPPLFTHIILLSPNPFLILPTIRSRCQILNFSNISKEEIERILKEKGYPEDQAGILSLLVNGNLERALSLDWEEVRRSRSEALNLFLSMMEGKGSSAFLSQYAFQRRSLAEDDFERALEMFASFCRDIVLIKESGEHRLLLNPDFEEELRKAERRWTLAQSLDCLTRTDKVLAGLSKTMNMNLLAGDYYSNFGEWSHV